MAPNERALPPAIAAPCVGSHDGRRGHGGQDPYSDARRCRSGPARVMNLSTLGAMDFAARGPQIEGDGGRRTTSQRGEERISDGRRPLGRKIRATMSR